MFGMQGHMGQKTLQGPFRHWHKDREILPVLPPKLEFTGCGWCWCSLPHWRRERGFVLRERSYIYLKVVRGKVTRVEDKRSGYLYNLWGQSWLFPDNLYPSGVTQLRWHHGVSAHSLGAPTSIPCSSFSAKAGIEQPRMWPQSRHSRAGFKGTIPWHYRWTRWHCPGSAAAFCVTLLKSLPSSCCLWLTHRNCTFSKVWPISSYFCPVPGNKAVPLLTCASQHHCDTTIA